jgi:hypothetical protein
MTAYRKVRPAASGLATSIHKGRVLAGQRPLTPTGPAQASRYTSVCSAISRASFTSIPR